ncbi:MAG: LysR family nod box-dependent transcriptional activator [Halioglobus sp.]|jgi:LysR family nod box-dependent transcriptional activator
MNLRRINLNLLTILRELLRTASVSRAAERLDLGQSTVSGALSRLRDVFDDPLLVPSGRNLVLTSRAQEILPELEASLLGIEGLFEVPRFDPLVATGIFTIGTGLISLLPGLHKLLAERAPKLQMQAVTPVRESLQRLTTGTLDMLVAPPGLEGGTDVKSQHLYTENMLCLVARNHPSIKDQISNKNYQAHSHIVYMADTNLPSSSRFSLAGVPALEHIQAYVPSLPLMPFMIGASECIGLVPQQVATPLLEAAGVRVVETQFKQPQLPMHLYWSQRNEADPLQSFVRALLLEVGQSLD